MATIRELRAKFSATADSFRSSIRDIRENLHGIGTSTERAVDDSNSAVRNFQRTLGNLERAIQDSGNADSFEDLNRVLQNSQRELAETGNIGEEGLHDIQAAIERARGDFSRLGDSGTDSMREIENAINEVERELTTFGSESQLDELNRDLNRVEENLEDVGDAADRETGQVGGAFEGLRGRLAGFIGIIAGIFAVDRIIEFTKTLLNTTADLQAMQGQYEQVMAGMKASTDKYLNYMSQTWNKHPNELKKAYMQYVAILKSKGVAEEEAHNLAKQFLERTVDANAFANEDMESTVARFMGGIKGEYDSLDTAMVNLSATMMNDLSLKEYGKKFDELTVAEQEALKAQEMLRQHTSAGVFGQGAREADSYANNVAMLKNTWGEFLAEYGAPVLVVANKVLKDMIGWIDNLKTGIDNAKSSLAPFKEYLQGIFALFSGDTMGGLNLLSKLGLSSDQLTLILNGVTLIKDLFGTLWQIVLVAFNGIKNAAIQAWGFLAPYIMPLVQQIVSFVGEKVRQISGFWNQYGSQIMVAVQNAFNFILSIIQFIMPVVLLIINSVWTSIKGVINGALSIIIGLVKIFTGLFTADWSLLWEGVKQLLSGALEFLWNLFNLLMIGKLLGGIKAFITGGINFFKGFALDIASTFRGWIDDVISLFTHFRLTGMSIWQSITSAISNTVRPFVATLKGLFDEVLQNATSIFNGVKNAIMHPIQTARDVVKGIVGEIKGFFSGMKLELPKIKMPHFKIKNWSKNPLDWLKAMPSLDIDWYADGGVFAPNSPRMIGIGDADVPEAALPLSDSVLGKIGAMIAATMPKSEGTTGDVIVEVPVFLEGREVARGTYRYTTEYQEFEKDRDKKF